MKQHARHEDEIDGVNPPQSIKKDKDYNDPTRGNFGYVNVELQRNRYYFIEK